MNEFPLRIAMISYYLPSGSKIGVGYQVDQLARELVTRGHTVDVFSECGPVEGAPYGHHHVPLTGHLRTFRFATALRRLDFSSYDVLHAHGDDYWMWRRRVAAHVRTLHGSCFDEALHIRGLIGRLRMTALGFTEVLSSLAADEAVAVSPGTRRWTPWVRRVIPNGVNSRRFHPDGTRRTPHPVVLFVGTWGARKRGQALADAFVRQIRPVLPNAELWMVTQDAPTNPGTGVRVLGRVSDQELASLYQRAWVFCLPSSYEGFGIPYAEAMASGVPVVATANAGARFVLEDGRAGVLCSIDDLGSTIRDLLTDESRRVAVAHAGRRRARDFDLSVVADEYERLYRQLLDRSETMRVDAGPNVKAAPTSGGRR